MYTFTVLDELVYYLLFLVCLCVYVIKKLNILILWSILFLMLTTIYLLLQSGLNLTANEIVNFRRLAIIPFCVILVSSLKLRKSNFNSVYLYNSNIGLVVATFGIIEVASGLDLWYFLQLSEFWQINPTDLWAHIPLEEHGRFITHDLYELTGSVQRRMVSTYAEPTTLSIAFLGFIYSEYLIGNNKS